MASITKAYTQTLSAATATDDTVTGTSNAVEIVNHGSGTVYFRFGSTAPTVAGADCQPVLAGERVRVASGAPFTNTQIRMISAGTPTVSIVALIV